MYDKSLEQLIDAVIADGVITDQERKVVYKKAAALGIDQDEIEVYLEGRLDALNNAQKSKSGKHGNIKTCPNCGATVGSFEIKCKECGYQYRNTESVESMADFVKKITATKSIDKKCELIRTFPIPNDRESLLEFLAVSIPNSKNAMGAFDKGVGRWIMIVCGMIVITCIIFLSFGYDTRVILPIGVPSSFVFAAIAYKIGKDNTVSKAWNVKTQIALNKIRLTSINDTEITTQAKSLIADYNTTKRKRFIIWSVELFITIVIFCVAFCSGSSMGQVRSFIESNQYSEAENAMDNILERTNRWERYDKYAEFMNLCVHHMCINGEYKKAQLFIHEKENKLKQCDHWRDRTETIEQLEKIVSSYKEPSDESGQSIEE